MDYIGTLYNIKQDEIPIADVLLSGFKHLPGYNNNNNSTNIKYHNKFVPPTINLKNKNKNKNTNMGNNVIKEPLFCDKLYEHVKTLPLCKKNSSDNNKFIEKKEESDDKSDICSNKNEHCSFIESKFKEIIQRFTLNDDQSLVVEKVAKWFINPNEPLVLVHGVFGSGYKYF